MIAVLPAVRARYRARRRLSQVGAADTAGATGGPWWPGRLGGGEAGRTGALGDGRAGRSGAHGGGEPWRSCVHGGGEPGPTGAHGGGESWRAGDRGTGRAGAHGGGDPRRAGGLGSGEAGRGLIAVGVGVGVVAAAGGLRLVVAAGAGVGVAAIARRRHLAALPARRRRTQLPEALDRLAATLRGGASVPTALADVGGGFPAPLGPELAALGAEAAGGRPTAEVLDAWASSHDDRGTRLAATALVLAAAVGAAPARAADGVAATLRERADLADERHALAAQARMSAVVLSVAPIGFAALLSATDAGAQAFLLGSPAGWACLATGLALDAAGAAWMTRLTRGREA